jgi:PLP dependent protein
LLAVAGASRYFWAMTSNIAENLAQIRSSLATFPHAKLVAVSKTQSAATMRAAFAAGQRVFGENYVQEALAKQLELQDLPIEWHFIGPLQSNKADLVAKHFDWLHSLDRAKLIGLLAAARPPSSLPLNVLIQVNIDDEQSKSGCAPNAITALAEQICMHPSLQLRGLMCIPKPNASHAETQQSFAAMRLLFESLRNAYPSVDTLSMGMSADYELALAQGSTLVRVGSAIFGARH